MLIEKLFLRQLKDQPINAVEGNIRCLLWESYVAHEWNVWQSSFLI